MTTILYNPLSDNGRGRQNAEAFAQTRSGETTLADITAGDPLETLAAADGTVILTGGDGTLHRTVNILNGKPLPREVYYAPGGSGNDFWNDVKDSAEDGVILLNPYVEKLPTVTVCGKTLYFLNGIGFGIDGFCCEEGDRLRASGQEKINYTAIAIKGLLGKFHPADAEVTVDGVTKRYRRTWLAPTMNGRFYGGGMMVAPSQDRKNPARTVSTVVLYGSGKLKTLTVFPSIFKGGHVAHTEMVEVFSGREITVRFDRPTPLQIDGETVSGVTEYTVRAGV